MPGQLGRIRKLTGLAVTGVRREAGPPVLWALDLDDGRLVVLGSNHRAQDAPAVNRVLAAAGGRQLGQYEARRLIQALHRAVEGRAEPKERKNSKRATGRTELEGDNGHLTPTTTAPANKLRALTPAPEPHSRVGVWSDRGTGIRWRGHGGGGRLCPADA